MQVSVGFRVSDGRVERHGQDSSLYKEAAISYGDLYPSKFGQKMSGHLENSSCSSTHNAAANQLVRDRHLSFVSSSHLITPRRDHFSHHRSFLSKLSLSPLSRIPLRARVIRIEKHLASSTASTATAPNRIDPRSRRAVRTLQKSLPSLRSNSSRTRQTIELVRIPIASHDITSQ